MIGSLLLYVETVYPTLLPAYGGGRLTPIKLKLVDEKVLSDGAVSRNQQWFLIADTDQWVAVTPEDPLARRPFAPRHALRLKTDTVVSIASGGP